jgi:hypothetical protein
MEGDVSLSTPHSPSILQLLASQTHNASPVSDWLKNASTAEEEVALLATVDGIPLVWLKWAHGEMCRREKHHYKIHSQIDYAINTILNGLIILQESKFICDVLENALRSSIINFILLKKITYKQLYPPNYLKKIRIAESKFPDDPSVVVSSDFIINTDFSQLKQTIALNWDSNFYGYRYCPADKGFRSLFWSSVQCRDVNLFQSDMDRIRRYRNSIAHSRRLFSIEELLDLNKLVGKWLSPLNIQLMDKIIAYRKNRPNFLEQLDDNRQVSKNPSNSGRLIPPFLFDFPTRV